MLKTFLLFIFFALAVNNCNAQSATKKAVQNSVKDSTPRKKSQTPGIVHNTASSPMNTTPKAKTEYTKEGGSKSSSIFKDILPIITLLLGIGINKLLDRLKDTNRINKAGERWVAELRGLENPIQQQIDLLNALLNEDSEDRYDISELEILSTLNCEIFKSLDKSELYKYIKRHKYNDYDKVTKTSNQTHGLISILIHLHESLKDKFKEYLSGVSQHTGTANRNLQQLSQAFAWYGADLEMELGGNPVNDPRYRPILDLFNQYIEPHREDGAYDLYQLQSDFFWPLILFLAHLRHDDRARNMSNFASECFNAIKGIRMEKRYWRENVSKISGRYTENLAGLKEVVVNIEQWKKST